MNVNQAISIINEEGQVEQGFFIVDPKVDRQGLISISKEQVVEGVAPTVIRVHPKRILIGDATVTQLNTEVAAVNEKVAPKQPKPTPQKIEMGNLAAYGELWYKPVEFDGQTDVKANCLLFPTQGRYLSFNTYGGTFGKKGKQPPIQDVLDGKDVGYPIKDLAKMRVQLSKKGYTLYGAQGASTATTSEG